MPLEALIFDVDGTLAETEELHRQAFNEAFHAFGLDWVWPRDLYRELLGVTGGRERILHYIDHYAPAGGSGARAKVSEMHADKTVRYVKLIRAGDVAPRPGVRRLIAEAHDAGLRLAIATTTRPGNVEALLGAMIGREALSWFSVIAAGDIVPAKKPARDIYDYALRELGCAASACVAFEDFSERRSRGEAGGPRGRRDAELLFERGRCQRKRQRFERSRRTRPPRPPFGGLALRQRLRRSRRLAVHAGRGERDQAEDLNWRIAS